MIDILEKMSLCMCAIWYSSSKKRTNAPTTSAELDIQNVDRLHMLFFNSKMEMLDGSANVDWCPTLFTESGRLFTQSAADS